MDSPSLSSSSLPTMPPPLPPPLPPSAEPTRENPAVLLCGLDSTKLTWGEWWRLGPGLAAVIGWCSKIFNTRILDAVRMMMVRVAAAFEISPAALSQPVQGKLFPQIDALRALGFGEPRVMRIVDVFTNREIVLAVQVHQSGRTLSRVIYAYPLSGATVTKKTFSVGFLSAFSDGRLLCTDEKRSKFVSAPNVLAKVKSGGVQLQFAAHEKYITEVGGASIVQVCSENVWQICDDYENALAAFGQSRGLFVPLTSAEGANVAAISCPEEARHAATLAELLRLQTARPKSMGAAALLIISFIIFAATGALRWSWQTGAIIAAALFVHELGHYLAMRCFKYRDLRMFFIPLFGAAVTGKHHNVAGWKKAVVSLMGPLPGIALGTAVALCGVFLHQPALGNAAVIVIFLNLFNLLPILPLDGGAFWNAVLFCRHRWLEAGFKSLAGLALMLGSLASGTWIFIYVGFLMVKGAPKTLRLGAAAARLREKGWQPGVYDTVSREAAETILAELKEPGKTSPAAKTAAADTLHVFEHLNARPPGVLGSFGLAVSYATAILLAFIGMGAGLSAENKTSSRTASTEPTALREHAPVLRAEFRGELAQFPAPGPAKDQSVADRRIIATFSDSKSAANVFEQLRAGQNSGEQVVQFGQSIIAVTPLDNDEGARRLVAQFRSNGEPVIDTGSRFSAPRFDLQFSAPNEEAAARMGRDLKTYFALPIDLRPIPPWVANATVKPEERKQFMKAAATYARVLEAQAGWLTDPEVERLTHSNMFWLIRSRKAAQERGQEIRARQDQFARNAVKMLKASGDPSLDADVLALALRQPRGNNGRSWIDALETWRQQMRELLRGCNEDREPFIQATVTVSGNRVTLHSVTFGVPEETLPALARYLTDSHCDEVRYGFYNSEVYDSARIAALR